MKELIIRATWKSSHRVEVPDNYEFTGGLDEEWADQIDTSTAELTDWEVTEVENH
jgi:hypothetical protein